MSHKFDVTVEDTLLEDDTPALGLKLSGPVVEVNVWFTLDEASALRRVLAPGGDSRGLRLGASANSQVHWSRGEDGAIHLLIGDDDETWDVGVTLPETTFREVLAEIEECLRTDSPRREADP